MKSVGSRPIENRDLAVMLPHQTGRSFTYTFVSRLSSLHAVYFLREKQDEGSFTDTLHPSPIISRVFLTITAYAGGPSSPDEQPLDPTSGAVEYLR